MPHPDKPLPSKDDRNQVIHGYGNESGREISLELSAVGIAKAISNRLLPSREHETCVTARIGIEVVRLHPYHPLAEAGVIRPTRPAIFSGWED